MDIRATAAKFYDLSPDFPDDIPFYLDLIPPEAAVLELGCGTGRVTLPLTERGNFVHGIDLSPAMVARCLARLEEAGIPPERVKIEVGDITRLNLGRTFDWIIAPYRVLQNLETDEQVGGLFAGIRAHLARGGCCILNVFHPNREPDDLRRHWANPQETLDWEQEEGDEKLVCTYRTARMEPEKLILYPEIIYRRYRGDELLEEDGLKIAMRCYYPEQFEALVRAHGFEIMDRWGGYHGEEYGHGPELVLQFH